MADTKQRASGGVGFLGLFFLVLFTLKVTGPLAGVSWWWITAPLWIPLAFLATLVLIVTLIMLVSDRRKHRRRRRQGRKW